MIAQHKPACKCDQKHAEPQSTPWLNYWKEALSFVLLGVGLVMDHGLEPEFFTGWVRLVWYLAAYLPVGIPVMREAWEALREGAFFTEFTLMLVATLGAFVIGEYAEGVGVMLFYAIGELFQAAAVGKAQRSIKALLDVAPRRATVLRGDAWIETTPAEVTPGETIRVRPGEKVPLDAELLSPAGSFNTSALTGESVPRTLQAGEQALAGMVNLDRVIEMRVVRPFADSSLARILEMVQQAPARKSRTELMIRRFARIYTPAVFGCALLLALAPYLIVSDYVFADWFYRALIFLVISCPCALVISIPLGYFGGIGAASRNGILFKGSNFLDTMARVNAVVMDKTGTLTEGVFEVQQIITAQGTQDELLKNIAALEQGSTHPIAKAILRRAGGLEIVAASDIEDIPGRGLRGKVNGVEVLAGNTRWLADNGISYDPALDHIGATAVACAVGGRYAGSVVIADRVKPDAALAIAGMHRNGVTITMMLSGDRDAVTQQVARETGIDVAYGDLLPEDKVAHVQRLMENPGRVVAFVGDGINDAPVLATSDIGIAMGAMGSDAAIETADVVIQTDQLSKIATAISIGRATRRIVIQNIALALGVKAVVMFFGAFGMATMWEAVFADVGVALLAILNAVRIQHHRF